MSSNRQQRGGRSPDVIIHRSLAQNLYKRLPNINPGAPTGPVPSAMPAVPVRPNQSNLRDPVNQGGSSTYSSRSPPKSSTAYSTSASTSTNSSATNSASSNTYDINGRNHRSATIHSSHSTSQLFLSNNNNSGNNGGAMTTLNSSSSTGNLGLSSPGTPSGRDRSRSGGHTPREMVWVDSKERLSEMATDIRGISNALSNVALSVAVKNILIVSKLSDEDLPVLTKAMVEWLLRWKPHVDDDDNATDPDIAKGKPGSAGSAASTGSGVGNSTSATSESGSAPLSFRNDRLETVVEPRSCSSGDLVVYVEDELAEKPHFGLETIRERLPEESKRLKLWSTDDVSSWAENIDLVITLGGDGTVLYTSWLFQQMVPPTLSFGLGSLGFMTENEYDEFPQIINEHLVNGICCTLRMRFECTVMRTRNDHKVGRDDLKEEMRLGGESLHFTSHYNDGGYTILNEVVVDRGPNPFVTMTELYGNFELLTSIQADGVVISTPTGSTAYSMSAGGSLVHPDIPAQLISPICPHTLSFRPLVVPDSMILHIGVPYDARSSAFVSFDGKARVELRRGDFLAINISRYPFPKVLPVRSTSVSWVQQLSRTLHWNEQKRPKRYTDDS